MLDMELKCIEGKNIPYMVKAPGNVTVLAIERYAKHYIDIGKCITIMLKKE